MTNQYKLPPPASFVSARCDSKPEDWIYYTADQMQAAYRAGQTDAQWLPIETAPKDFATEIDLWACDKRLTGCMWGHPEDAPKGEYDWVVPEYVQNYGWSNERVRNPTHWMPLPAAPKPYTATQVLKDVDAHWEKLAKPSEGQAS